MTLLPDPLVVHPKDWPESADDELHRLSPWSVQRDLEALRDALTIVENNTGGNTITWTDVTSNFAAKGWDYVYNDGVWMGTDGNIVYFRGAITNAADMTASQFAGSLPSSCQPRNLGHSQNESRAWSFIVGSEDFAPHSYTGWTGTMIIQYTGSNLELQLLGGRITLGGNTRSGIPADSYIYLDNMTYAI